MLILVVCLADRLYLALDRCLCSIFFLRKNIMLVFHDFCAAIERHLAKKNCLASFYLACSCSFLRLTSWVQKHRAQWIILPLGCSLDKIVTFQLKKSNVKEKSSQILAENIQISSKISLISSKISLISSKISLLSSKISLLSGKISQMSSKISQMSSKKVEFQTK